MSVIDPWSWLGKSNCMSLYLLLLLNNSASTCRAEAVYNYTLLNTFASLHAKKRRRGANK